MWIFADYGLHMPAIVPAKHKNDPEVLKWTNNGEYELQVRARLREHLQYFMDTYMEPGTFNPEIQATPDKDYNYRFYTTREAYAEGVKRVVLAMDYEKFKDSSLRFSWNKKYHSILTSIWAKLCELNTPGGIWGPRSAENPRGYTKASRYSSWRDYEDGHRAIGSTFLEGRENVSDDTREGYWWEDYDDRADWEMNPVTGEWDRIPREQAYSSWEDSLDYTPSKTLMRDEILEELDGNNIPVDQWQDYLTESEWILVQPEAEKRLIRQKKRGNRRNRGRNKGRRNRPGRQFV